MARIKGWRAVAAGLIAVVVLVLLAAVLFWVAIGVALLVGLAVLHLIYLPRLAGWLGIAPSRLALGLLPLALLVGWVAAGEAVGLLWGAGGWALLVAAPRLALGRAGLWLRGRAGAWTVRGGPTGHRPPQAGQIIETVACPDCGRFRIAGSDEPCPSCGAASPGRALPR